jgi:hypothetical protein
MLLIRSMRTAIPIALTLLVGFSVANAADDKPNENTLTAFVMDHLKVGNVPASAFVVKSVDVISTPLPDATFNLEMKAEVEIAMPLYQRIELHVLPQPN